MAKHTWHCNYPDGPCYECEMEFTLSLITRRRREQQRYAEAGNVAKAEHIYAAGVLRNIEKELCDVH